MTKTTFTAILSSLVLLSPTIAAHELYSYGSVNLSIDAADDGQASNSSIASNSSHIGFAGDYQITDSVSAIFQYEAGVDLTFRGHNDGNAPTNDSPLLNSNDHGRFFTQNRSSFIGLSGNFGQVKIGHLAATDQWLNDYNLFENKVGDLGNFWAGSGLPNRLDDVIQYVSPQFADFDVALTYKPQKNNYNSHFIVKGNYTKDRLKVGLALATIGLDKTAANDHKVIAITTSYQLDYFSIGAGLQSEFDVAGIADNDRDSLFIGATAYVTKRGKFKLQFANSVGSGIDKDATMFAIGYDYTLNQNTQLYVAYANTNNGYNVAFSANGSGHGQKLVPQLGDSPSVLSLGIIYTFDKKFKK